MTTECCCCGTTALMASQFNVQFGVGRWFCCDSSTIDGEVKSLYRELDELYLKLILLAVEKP